MTAEQQVERLTDALAAAREALEGTLALTIAWAAHYEIDQKLGGFHPTHSRIIAKARETLNALNLPPAQPPTL